MLGNTLFFVVGLVLVYFGAEGTVWGASRLAQRLGIRPLIVGMTVVAFGTSAPELLVSVVASYKGQTDIALGNVLGSNIANTFLVLGSAAIFVPLAVRPAVVRWEMPQMVVATVAVVGFGLMGWIGRIPAGILFAGFVAFMVGQVISGYRGREKRVQVGGPLTEEMSVMTEEEAKAGGEKLTQKPAVMGLAVGLGITGLVGGAELMVRGAVGIAETLGVSKLTISITMVALGTSLPELAASLVGALRGHLDLSIGNVVGSNLFNLLMVMGAAGLVRPIAVSPALYYWEMPLLLASSLMLWGFARTGYRVSRVEGWLLLMAYVVFVVGLAVRPSLIG